MFDPALSAQCADVVSPAGKQPGGAAALGSPYGGAGERSETERAFAVANLHIGAVIERIPGGNHGAFFIFATACALSVTAFSRASSPIGRAKGRASPPSAEGKTVGIRRLRRPAHRNPPAKIPYRPFSRYVGTFNAAYPGWGFFRGIFCTSIRFFPTSWVTALPWFTCPIMPFSE